MKGMNTVVPKNKSYINTMLCCIADINIRFYATISVRLYLKTLLRSTVEPSSDQKMINCLKARLCILHPTKGKPCWLPLVLLCSFTDYARTKGGGGPNGYISLLYI